MVLDTMLIRAPLITVEEVELQNSRPGRHRAVLLSCFIPHMKRQSPEAQCGTWAGCWRPGRLHVYLGPPFSAAKKSGGVKSHLIQSNVIQNCYKLVCDTHLSCFVRSLFKMCKKPWIGGSVGWSIVLYTKSLRV